MNFVEAFRVALTALFSNRLRSILTMLGIIIGVAAVVALVSLGQSFQNYVTGQFTSIGSNLMFIVPSRPSGPGSKLLKIKPLTMADATAIANPLNVPGLAAVAPSYNVATDLTANGHSISMSITGVTTSWQSVLSWQMADGRFIDDTDNNTSSAVVVIGSTVANKLFGTGADVVGQSVRINNIPFRIVGLFKTKGGLGNQDQIAVVPLTTAQTRLGDAQARATNGGYTVSVIYAQSISKDTTQVAKTAITNLLSQRHNVQYQGNEDFQIVTLDQILNTLGNVTGLITIFLAVVAGISLVVGGIGVMNIMLVSVTERTREIGLRKAIGARRRDLMAQFLIESVVLTVTGGLIGVAFGGGIAFLASQAIPSLSMSVGLPAIILATGVSTAIGVFFGLYPATRAAALSPIEALRYE